MMMQLEKRTCLHCDKTIQGRSDKKFCDDYCRNNYNNQVKASSNNFVRNINNALKKNRRILESILPETEGTAKTTRQNLLDQGFQFKYNTHSYTNKKGNTYLFCYDYGYLPLEDDWYLLVKVKKAIRQ
jgi:predicted nucleic acid-binding Zn ribbon protein